MNATHFHRHCSRVTLKFEKNTPNLLPAEERFDVAFAFLQLLEEEHCRVRHLRRYLPDAHLQRVVPEFEDLCTVDLK